MTGTYPGRNISIFASQSIPRINLLQLREHIAPMGLRLALAAAFLSAVASRFEVWGARGSNWARFVRYTAYLNWFLPESVAPLLAVAATIVELTLIWCLILGWRLKWTAYGSAALLLLYAILLFTADPKAVFDESTFTAAFGALLLGNHYSQTENGSRDGIRQGIAIA